MTPSVVIQTSPRLTGFGKCVHLVTKILFCFCLLIGCVDGCEVVERVAIIICNWRVMKVVPMEVGFYAIIIIVSAAVPPALKKIN